MSPKCFLLTSFLGACCWEWMVAKMTFETINIIQLIPRQLFCLNKHLLQVSLLSDCVSFLKRTHI